MVIILTRGKDTKNPAKTGFLNESQLAIEINVAETIILIMNNN